MNFNDLVAKSDVSSRRAGARRQRPEAVEAPRNDKNRYLPNTATTPAMTAARQNAKREELDKLKPDFDMEHMRNECVAYENQLYAKATQDQIQAVQKRTGCSAQEAYERRGEEVKLVPYGAQYLMALKFGQKLRHLDEERGKEMAQLAIESGRMPRGGVWGSNGPQGFHEHIGKR